MKMSLFVYAGDTTVMIAKTIEAAPLKPHQEINNCCLNGTLNGVKQINTVNGRATKVKNSVIRIAEPIISGICDGKDNKPSKKNNKICII